MNLGIIGYGNIGEMLVKNIVNSKSIKFNKLYISNRHINKIKHLKDISESICITDSNIELAKNCEKIIISVETPDLTGVLKEIKPYLHENTHVTHCSAGVDSDELEKEFNHPLTCVIPTISSTFDCENLKKGVSLFLHDENVSLKNREYIEDLFSKFSYIHEVENEQDLRISLIATSCMPAFIAQITGEMSEKLSENSSLTKNELLYLLTETLISTSLILKNNIYDNEELITKVATKGGITQKGLDYLNENMNHIENNLIKLLL